MNTATNNLFTRPAPGAALIVEKPEGNVTLGFDHGAANVERSGDSLVFSFEDGATLTVKDFFVTGDSALSDFVLENGAVMPGAELLASLNPDLDLQTAAGPSSGTSASSGGAGEYADDAGALVDGIGRLGSLGTNQWGSGFAADELRPTQALAALGSVEAGRADQPLPPVVTPPTVTPPTVTPPTPEPPTTTYPSGHDTTERIIAIRIDNHGNTLPSLTAGMNYTVASLDDANGENGYGTATLNADGTVSYTLSSAGIAALQSSSTGYLFDYITVTDEDGGSHTIQILYTRINIVDSPTIVDPDRPEFVPNHERIYSTSHQLHDQHINTGDGDDYIYLDSRVGSFHNGTIDFGSTINMGDGNDTLIIYGKRDAIGGHHASDPSSPGLGNPSRVDMGEGNNYVYLEAGQDSAIYRSSLTAGSGDDTVVLKGYGWGMHDAHVNLGDGDNDILVRGATAMESSSITTGDGNDTVTIEGLPTNSGIHTGAGNDTITINGYDQPGFGWTEQLWNTTINAGDGDDTITVNIHTYGSTAILAGAGNDNVYIGSGVSNGTVISGGEGEDWLHLTATNYGAISTNAAIKISGFENLVVDLAGNGADDTMTIDAILNNLSKINHETGGVNNVYIKADASDALPTESDFTGNGFTKGGTTVNDGVTYQAYHNEAESYDVYIQIMNAGG